VFAGFFDWVGVFGGWRANNRCLAGINYVSAALDHSTAGMFFSLAGLILSLE